MDRSVAATEKGFLDWVSRLFGVASPSLSLQTAYASIPEWDSVMHLRLILETESAYGVDIPIGDIVGIRTLGQLYDYVK